MSDLLVLIWTVLIFVSVAWYAFLLYYIGVRGGQDIARMIRHLKERNAGEGPGRGR